MLKKFNAIYFIFRKVLWGDGDCRRCGCGEYIKSDEGGDYCKCGHAYDDHGYK